MARNNKCLVLTMNEKILCLFIAKINIIYDLKTESGLFRRITVYGYGYGLFTPSLSTTTVDI